LLVSGLTTTAKDAEDLDVVAANCDMMAAPSFINRPTDVKSAIVFQAIETRNPVGVMVA
jgi:3-deoxy-D-manno-octulosonic acid (KDO) 8-phosphate synthase